MNKHLLIEKNPHGWNVEWYDGKGTYTSADGLKAYQIPFALVWVWWEVRRG